MAIGPSPTALCNWSASTRCHVVDKITCNPSIIPTLSFSSWIRALESSSLPVALEKKLVSTRSNGVEQGVVVAMGSVPTTFCNWSASANCHSLEETRASTSSSHSSSFRPLIRRPASSRLPGAAKQRPLSLRCNGSAQQRIVGPVSVCTDPEAVDAEELSALLAATRQNCLQFPSVLNDGTIVPVDPMKLRCALRHSTVVVALYANIGSGSEDDVREQSGQSDGRARLNLRDFWRPPKPAGKKMLIAFGRATSDHTLTASIYDLAVVPSFQRSGYGSEVLRRIVRDLRRRGISDIAVTPSPRLRLFFQHCGFGPDTLKSVTMMYTRSPCSISKSFQTKTSGRKSLLIPAPIRVCEDAISI